MKSRVIIANWKMHKTIGEAKSYARGLVDLEVRSQGLQIILAAPFPALRGLSEVMRGSRIELAAQNLHWEDRGPYTGEVSALQLRDAGCRYAIIGHSERRQHFGEGNEQVNRKIQAAIRNQLGPIVCVGESLNERRSDKTFDVVGEQISKALIGIQPELLRGLLIAYEPVWAIGTGQTVNRDQATETHRMIQAKVKELLGPPVSESIRVLYGGSVTARNAPEFLAIQEVDGLLVGGASLALQDFSEIIKCADLERA